MVATESEGEREGTWSSLPDLPLWMIKDRLDIFDNWRLAAVCRDWRLSSARYPKTLHSVGDGVPWIWHVRYEAQVQQSGLYAHARTKSPEFISITRKCKFQFQVPELDEGNVLSSKDGWILIRRIPSACPSQEFAESPLILNPFTGARIKLPQLTGVNTYHGLFTTCDGYPRRVFVFLRYGTYQDELTIKTASPGDEVWTSHNFPPMMRVWLNNSSFVAVGKKVCCTDVFHKRVTVFDVGSNTVKDFASLSRNGFIAEHNDELVYVDHGQDFTSCVVYRYNDDDPTSWERLRDGEVKDTSWYVGANSGCITAKGRGLIVYRLCQIKVPRYGNTESFVDVHDLVTGSFKTIYVPLPEHHDMFWIAIG